MNPLRYFRKNESNINREKSILCYIAKLAKIRTQYLCWLGSNE